MEIHIRTLLLVFVSLLGSLTLPLLAHRSSDEPPPAVQALPTATPVPERGLSLASQHLARTLLQPTATPSAIHRLRPTPVPADLAVATVHTNGANLNIRGGPGLDRPILGSAPNGLRLRVAGRSQDGQWLAVELPGWTRLGWVFAPLTVLEGDLARLPVREEE